MGHFDSFIGQKPIKNMLEDMLLYCKKCDTVFPHTLFIASAGQGKTTLSLLLSAAISENVLHVYAPTIRCWDDMKKILNKVLTKSVLYIDEIHALPKDVQECMYDVLLGGFYIEGPNKVTLPEFTVLASTTDPQKLSKPFFDRFPNTMVFEQYSKADLMAYLCMKVRADFFDAGVLERIAEMFGNSPRRLNAFLDKMRLYCIAHNVCHVTQQTLEDICAYIGLDKNGLNSLQVRYMKLLNERDCLSLATIASMLRLDVRVITDIVEPDLISMGYVAIESSGRHALVQY